MSELKKSGRRKAAPSPRQLEIDKLRKIVRGNRSEAQSDRLSVLMAEERRDRFVRLMPRRLEKLRKAVENVERLGNPQSYQCEESERDGIVSFCDQIPPRVKVAFRGAPREKGLYDL